VAHLNGTEVARQNAPVGNLAFDSSAVGLSKSLLNQYHAALPSGGGSANITTTASSNGGGPAGAAGSAGTYGSDKLVDGNFFSPDPGAGDVGGELQASGFYGHTTDPDPYMWFMAGPLFQSLAINEQYVSFSFADGPHVFPSMRVWNYNELTPGNKSNQTDRGVRDTWVWYSNNPTLPAITGAPGAASPGAGWTLDRKVTLPQAPGTGTYNGVNVDLGSFTAQHVLLMIDSNHGDPSYAGLSEVQFGSDGTLVGPGTGHDTVDLTSKIGSLIAGTNVLAIQGLNVSDTDTDFLLRSELTGQRVSSSQILDPGERVLVVRDQKAFETRYGGGGNIAGQYSGRLNNGGERLRLETSTGETILDFSYNDNDPWPERTDGHGGTLVLTNLASTPSEQFHKYYHWHGSTQFGGTPGTAATAPAGVVINEVLAHTDPPVTEPDSIELYNPTSTSMDLSGWFLSDTSDNFLKFEIPPATVLPAGGYLVIDEDDLNPTPTTPGPNHFSLSGARGDDVWLTIPNGSGGITAFVDDVHFGASLNGEAMGRLPNGSGRLMPLVNATLGTVNSNARVGPVVISEFNYHPEAPSAAALSVEPALTVSDLEFLEIYNSSAAAVDLTDWQIRGAVDFDFPAGITLSAGEVLLVISFDPGSVANATRASAFRTHYGIDESVMLLGGYQGQLSDSDERVEIQRPDLPSPEDPTLIPRIFEDELLYDDLLPWDVSADGGGKSFHRTGLQMPGSRVASWTAGAPLPGRVISPGDTDLDGDVDTTDLTTAIINFTSAGGVGKTWADGDVDGDGDVDTGDLTVAIINFTSAMSSQEMSSQPQASGQANHRFTLVPLDRTASDVPIANRQPRVWNEFSAAENSIGLTVTEDDGEVFRPTARPLDAQGVSRSHSNAGRRIRPVQLDEVFREMVEK